MAQTADFLINRAYSIAGIKKGNVDVEDDEMDIAIDTLNDMMTAFAIDGIALNFQLIAAKEDEITSPDWSNEMVKTQLALRLQNEFGRTTTIVLIEQADRAMRLVLKMTREDRGLALPATLPVGSGNGDRFRSNTFYPDRECGDLEFGNGDIMYDDEGHVLKDNSGCNTASTGDSNG